MPLCVRCSKKPAKNLFKGRFLCFPHFQEAMQQLSSILQNKETREDILLLGNEKVAINSPRHLIDPTDGHVRRIRGQHFTITKNELGVS
jgi:hypothetical protein